MFGFTSAERLHRVIMIGSLTLLWLSVASTDGQSIVNLDARSNNFSNPVRIPLDAGIYSVQPISTAEGGSFTSWTAWSSTSCSDPDGCVRTSPTTVTGWLHIYRIRSPHLTHVSVDGMDLTPILPGDTPDGPSFFMIDGNDTQYVADDGLVFPDPASAFDHALSSTFRVSEAGLVDFIIPDIPLSDNSGGLSLLVTAIPEPSALVMTGFGMVATATIRRANRH